MKSFEVGRSYTGYWFDGADYVVMARNDDVAVLGRYDRFGKLRYYGTYHVRRDTWDADNCEFIEDIDYCDDDFMLAEPID